MAPCQGGEESQPIRARVRAMSFFADLHGTDARWAARPARWHGSRLRGLGTPAGFVITDELFRAIAPSLALPTGSTTTALAKLDRVRADLMAAPFPRAFPRSWPAGLRSALFGRCGRRSPAKTSPAAWARGSMNRGWRCGRRGRDGHPPGARFGSVCGRGGLCPGPWTATGGGASGGLASSLRARRGGRRRGLRGGVPR